MRGRKNHALRIDYVIFSTNHYKNTVTKISFVMRTRYVNKLFRISQCLKFSLLSYSVIIKTTRMITQRKSPTVLKVIQAGIFNSPAELNSFLLEVDKLSGAQQKTSRGVPSSLVLTLATLIHSSSIFVYMATLKFLRYF